MSTTDTPTVAPEVQEFLDAVRAQLADLDVDEQRDITEGLEADLTDLVAERGRGALGDPVAYARELRAAAGLEPEMAGPTGRRGWWHRVDRALDACRARTDRVVQALPGDAAPLLHWLRPVWWIVRAWAALELVDLLFGRGRYAGDLTVVPHLRGFGWALLLLAVVASVQLGRGAFWPGGSRGPGARLVLVLLNAFALVMIPLVLVQVVARDGGAPDDRYGRGWNDGYRAGADEVRASVDKAGLYADGKWVSQIYPYDAQGRPLVGVQLFNQVGQPINVVTQPEYVDDIAHPNEGKPLVYYPWTNGATQVLNVFPIPSRVQEGEQPSATAFAESTPPVVAPFPLAAVPSVSLPGIRTGVQRPDR